MFRLPPDVEEKLAEARRLELSKKETFASLDDRSLVASAKFWMQHCVAPRKYEPSDPIYDSTMWHVILPELIRRLEK